MLNCSLLLGDGAQHIAGAGNIRQVNLGLDAFVDGRGARGLRRTRRRLRAAAEMFSHQVSFVIFQRTGVRFLLRDADYSQRVQNFSALDL
jgi:hypothetical protein